MQYSYYDKETEVFTENGFVPFKELTTNHKVLIRSIDETLGWSNVYNVMKEEYVGPMTGLRSATLDLLITPNKRMLYRKITSDLLYTENLTDTKTARRIPKISIWKSEEPKEFEIYGAKDLESFVAFMGIWLSEGWANLEYNKKTKQIHYRIGVAQTKPESSKKIKDLLESTFPNISWVTKRRNGQEWGFVGNHKPLFLYLQNIGKVLDKYIPKEIKDLPRRYLDIFLEWFIIGDGSIHRFENKNQTDMVRIITSSKKLRDGLIELIIKTGKWMGYYDTIGKISAPLEDGRRIQSSTKFYNYCILLHKSKDHHVKANRIIKEDYNGPVYNCIAGNNAILVKRNRKMIWCMDGSIDE